MKTRVYSLPDYLAPYLINDDSSGLNDDEIKEVDNFIAKMVKYFGSFYCVGCSDYAHFEWRNDLNNLGGNVLEFTFCVKD